MNENSAGSAAKAVIDLLVKGTGEEQKITDDAKKVGGTARDAALKKASKLEPVQKAKEKAGEKASKMFNSLAKKVKKKVRDAGIDAGVKAADKADEAIAAAGKAGVKAAEKTVSAVTLGVGAPAAKAASMAAEKGIDTAKQVRTTMRHNAAEETKQAADKADGAKQAAASKPIGADAISGLVKGKTVGKVTAVATGKDVGKSVIKGLTGR